MDHEPAGSTAVLLRHNPSIPGGWLAPLMAAVMRIQSEIRLPVVPENAASFAASTVDKVQRIKQIGLDYSADSLRHIDAILGEFHSNQATVNDVALTLFSFGCYVGEVIVRNIPGARWTTVAPGMTESSLNSGLLVQLPSGTILNPIGKVEKRLLNGEIDSVAYFYYAFAQHDPGAASPGAST